MTVQRYALNRVSCHIGQRLLRTLRDVRTGQQRPLLRHDVSRLEVVTKRASEWSGYTISSRARADRQ